MRGAAGGFGGSGRSARSVEEDEGVGGGEVGGAWEVPGLGRVLGEAVEEEEGGFGVSVGGGGR